MTPELQNKLYTKYPKLFAQKDLSITQSCMSWGIECGDGWYNIIDKLCQNIQHFVDNERKSRCYNLRYNRALKKALDGNKEYLENYFKSSFPDPQKRDEFIEQTIQKKQFGNLFEKVEKVQFTQIKEKFATLRVYVNCHYDYVQGVIDMASSMSSITCESCGKLGNIRGKYWIYTSCDVCDDKKR